MISKRIEVPQDVLWKSLLEDIFPEFLKYFFPNAEDLFDFSLGVSFLDKELEQLFPEGDTQNRRADKLAKVYLKNGVEQWVLVHIEIQGYWDEHFSERMYQYFYRIRDRHKQSVVAFAILTDNNVNYRPAEYRYELLGTELVYRYNFLKLSDYSPADFQQSNSLFAIALETAWYGLRRQQLDDQKLYELKFDLCRRILQRGYVFSDFVRLFNFIKFYVSFGNTSLLSKFENEIRNATNQPKTNMGIVEAIETYITQKAEEIGLQRGMEKGMAKGIEKIAREAIPKLRALGMDADTIANILNIPVDFVEEVIASPNS
jgi:hypothetical protein